MTQTDKDILVKAPRGRRWWLRGLLSGILSLAVLLVVLSAGLLVVLKDREVNVPDWANDKIAERIAIALPELDVKFDGVGVVFADGWRPQVRFRAVRLTARDGAEIVSLNQLSAVFSMRALLRGELQPYSISVSGVFARLIRAADGQFSLSTAFDAAAPTRQAASLPALIGQVDQILTRPAASALNSAEVQSLTLRYEDLRAGRGWTVDGARLSLSRTGDALALSADLAVLSGGADAATLSANYTSVIGQTAARFGLNFEGVSAQDIAAQGPVFAWLGALRAPISGAVRSGLTTEGRFEPLHATLQIGAGVVQPTSETEAIAFDGARGYFSYQPRQQLLTFDEVSLEGAWLTGQATGNAQLGIDPKTGRFTQLVAQMRLNDVTANPFALFPDPIALSQVEADFRLTLDPFSVQFGRVLVMNQEDTLHASGEVFADPAGWRVSADAQMDAILPARVFAHWPQSVIPRTRRFLAENIAAGRLENIDVALRRQPGEKPTTYLSFDYSDAQVRFMKTLPPLQQARGRFSLLDNRLVISVDQGHVTAREGGDVDVGGSSFIIPFTGMKERAPAVVRLQTASKVTAVLSLLNAPPLSTMDKANLPVDLAQGDAVLDGTIAMPLTPPGEKRPITYHVEGTVSSFRSDVLVKDRVVEAQELNLAADNSALNITGVARVDGVPIIGTWRQTLGQNANGGQLEGEVALTQDTLDTFGVALPSGSVAGQGAGQLALSIERDAPPRFALRSDLQGLRLSVPQISWTKPAERAGRLNVEGLLGSAPRVHLLELEGPGLRARGQVDLHPDGALDRVRFDDLRVGSWLDIPLDLLGRGRGQPVQVVLRGGNLDLRRADFGETGSRSGPPPPPMRVALDRIQITDAIALTDVDGVFETAAGLSGSFTARLNGGTAVRGEITPRDGRSAIRLTSEDAGGVFRSANLLKQVVGRKLSLLLVPVGSGGAFDGQLTVTDVRVKDAPGIAALLNAVSVVGLINELNGDGIYFDTVEGRFRLTPDRLTLSEASAVGASMGLSMDGIYLLQSGQIDMQGAITPIYLINGVGSVLTRRGEGLFGFNYRLRGPAQKPSVSVNPLSALTPGMFREIFRRPPPELPNVEGITQSVLPPSAAASPSSIDESYEGR
ncbi:MAG: DUF3971 domain-containing protein [Pseudomonadota bacterium]